MNRSNPICIVIAGPSKTEAQEQLARANQCAELVEFRLDLFNFTDIKSIENLKQHTTLPTIFTLRHPSHGGAFKGTENERLSILKEIVKLNPTYIDLEWDAHPDLFAIVPPKQLICSSHNFDETPSDLAAAFNALMKHPAAIYKMATKANTSLDALRMLKCIRQHTQKGHQFVGICMGEDGVPTRILGPIFGNAFTYAVLDESQCVAPGQLDVQTLIDTYHFRKLSKTTQLLGLLGDPVSKSIGHKRHNQTFRNMGEDAVYVKMRIPQEHLQQTMGLAQELGFCGLSVTMPLKEKAMNYVSFSDPATQSIGALNTLVLTSQSISAYNTDGEAALKAILEKTPVSGKHVVMIGAGGAAKAILHYLNDAGAKLTILNRTLQSAQDLATKYRGKSGTLADFAKVASEGYDILINSTCVGRDHEGSPIDCTHLLPNKVVMEVISVPGETPLVVEAKKRQCTIVYGIEMYNKQAVKQVELWFA